MVIFHVYSCLFHRCPMFPWFVAVVCLTPQNIPAVVALGESIKLLVVRSTRDRPGRKNWASGKFKLIYIVYLVGGFTPSEKILVSWDDYCQYMENQKCSKPPTRYNMYNTYTIDRSQISHWQIPKLTDFTKLMLSMWTLIWDPCNLPRQNTH